MILLIDIGNTHTHLGLADPKQVLKQANPPTARWFGGQAAGLARKFVGRAVPEGAALCSVVPRATPLARRAVRRLWSISPMELTARTVRGVGINYPRPETIGPDRLANAVAVKHHFGAVQRFERCVCKNGSRRRKEADSGAENTSASLPRRLRFLRRFLNSPCSVSSGRTGRR